MKTLKPWLLLALVFVVGVLFGVAGTRFVIRRAVREAILHPVRVQMAVEKRLVRKLDLNPDQTARLDRILTDARGQLGALRQQYRPPAALVFSNADAQINALLTPDQRVKYERLKDANTPFVRGLQAAP
jgi:hypothetical protein